MVHDQSTWQFFHPNEFRTVVAKRSLLPDKSVYITNTALFCLAEWKFGSNTSLSSQTTADPLSNGEMKSRDDEPKTLLLNDKIGNF